MDGTDSDDSGDNAAMTGRGEEGETCSLLLYIVVVVVLV